MIDSAAVKREISIEHAYRLIACGPVTLVTSFYRGDMNIMTASWLTPVSYRPLLIGLSVNQPNMTHALIKKADEFGLSGPSVPVRRQVRFCAAGPGRDRSKLVA